MSGCSRPAAQQVGEPRGLPSTPDPLGGLGSVGTQGPLTEREWGFAKGRAELITPWVPFPNRGSRR